MVKSRVAPWIILGLLHAPVAAIQDPSGVTADELLEKAEAYQAALRDELANLRERRQRQEHRLNLFRDLFQQGLVSRLELNQVEEELATSAEVVATRESESDRVAHLIAEARLLAASSQVSEPAMELYPGRASWTLDEMTSLAVFFERSFGRPLPVSALGQTEIHSRLGLDHRTGLDLALHPASREGQAMMTYLRELDIPYIAFGRAVEGGATGAHIHVGPQSVRLR